MLSFGPGEPVLTGVLVQLKRMRRITRQPHDLLEQRAQVHLRFVKWLPTQRLRRAGNRGRVVSMSIRLATAVNNNRNNLRANNRARPMRDCALGR
ncbi:hypothetical protein JAK44_19495 [Stenotrophomonas maltophilia]|uniref:hypothetical protein n=1 Tax=Stenotrophomonas TaxID=40323 RepID=UPI0021C7D9E5|nr:MULTISPECIES: hypothetical protein [Stenotrophomonas]MCU1003120.1 hypothetical protein [Stenotrophomonas maltophilia]